MNIKRIFVISIIACTAFAIWLLSPQTKAGTHKVAQASMTIPDFTAAQKMGREAFNNNCAQCHGLNAAGTEQGPPLVHRIYEPSHHGDVAFLRAAFYGVKAHHWPFGDMPPVEGITQAEVVQIVDYIRALQRANGIE